MRMEYNFSKLKGHKKPCAQRLRKQVMKNASIRLNVRHMVSVAFVLVFIAAVPLLTYGKTMQDKKDNLKEDGGIGSPKNAPLKIEPNKYWFYEAMDMLEEVSTEGEEIRGAFRDRSTLFYFTVSKEKLHETHTREEGYKMAIEKIIALMAPNAVSDNEANRKYLAEKEEKMRSMTGKDFKDYSDWKEWFETSRNKLQWSEEKNMLLVEE